VIILLAIHAAVAAAIGLWGRPLGAKAFLVGLVAPLATVTWAVTRLAGSGPEVAETASWSWVPGLDLDLTFRADGLSMVILTVIGGIGVLIFVYAASYF